MPAFTPRAMPDNLALLSVLEATIETLKAENEILKRQLAAAETLAAQAAITETARRAGGRTRQAQVAAFGGVKCRSALPLLAKLPHEKADAALKKTIESFAH